MLDLTNNTLRVPGYEPEPILSWAVYFVTSEGTFETLDAAIISCERSKIPLIVPVPVARGKTTYEVVLNQGVILDS